MLLLMEDGLCCTIAAVFVHQSWWPASVLLLPSPIQLILCQSDNMAVALFNILSMIGESTWSKAIYMAVHPKKYWKKPLLSQENRSPQNGPCWSIAPMDSHGCFCHPTPSTQEKKA